MSKETEQARLEQKVADIQAKTNKLVKLYYPNIDECKSSTMPSDDVKKMVLTAYLMGSQDGVEEVKQNMTWLGIYK